MLIPAGTYQNPVFPESFPDPFVLKFCGEYFAYCTGFAKDGLAVGVAHSRDLVDWDYVGGALRPLSTEPPYYWAPEVVYHNGRFYMYYSCGNETLMEIRVAVSDRPDGGFVDSGHRLTREDFAIDAHVFTDEDGRRYMFYATDFLDHSHIGTGTVVDRMVSWFELEGNPKTVSRAAYDWQVYDPHRIEKGGVRWHTVEGPTVFKYKRKYFEMFSGGNWQNSSYGVAFAVSDAIDRPDEWRQSVDGISVLPVLRTIPDKVIGPGHNSAAAGPNGRELFCVYHCWKDGERVVAIDRMGFAGERLFVNGPTYTPQPAPLLPAATTDSLEWELSGEWQRGANLLANKSATARAEISTRCTRFLAELCFRAVTEMNETAEIRFGGVAGEQAVFSLSFSAGSVEVSFAGDAAEAVSLPEPADLAAFQHLRLEIDGSFISCRLNSLPLPLSSKLAIECDRFFMEISNVQAEIRGFALTPGFEDLFERDLDSPSDSGWRISGPGTLDIVDGELRLASGAGNESIAWKGEPFESFECVANVRLVNPEVTNAAAGFALITADGTVYRRFWLEMVDGRTVLSDTLAGVHLPLPPSYTGESHRQFRFLKIGSLLRVESEECLLSELEADSNAGMVGILTSGTTVAAEMFRWTPLPRVESESD